jgi:rod shape-determining protein MreC
MIKKHFSFFFIGSIIFIVSLIWTAPYFRNIYLEIIQKIHRYSIMYKSNADIYKLIVDYQKLKKEHNETIFLKKELEEYKKYINNGKTFERKKLITEIIGYTETRENKFIIINRGSVDKMAKHMVVVDPTNCIIGKITEVYDHYSKVIPLDNIDQYISVIFENNIEAILQGNRNEQKNTMKVIHIYNNQHKNINDAQPVFSSGKGLLFPAGFMVGKIIKHNLDNYLDHNIIIKNEYDLQSSPYSFVIIPENHAKNIEFFLQNKNLWNHLRIAGTKNNQDE